MAVEDYSTFASDSFDPNDYANAVLAGESYPPSKFIPPKTSSTAQSKTLSAVGQEDISTALAKLNYGIDDVAKQLRTVIVNHHEDLLTRASSVNELEGSLQSVRQGLDSVGFSLDKLRSKIRVPYQNLSEMLLQLQRLQVAADALRRTHRFVVLARRLEGQMVELDRINVAPPSLLSPSGSPSKSRSALAASGDAVGEPEGDKERIVAQAALYITELADISSPGAGTAKSIAADDETERSGPGQIDLRSIDIVARHLPEVDAARARVTTEMETMVLSGLESLNQALLVPALQTGFNLRVLPDLVQSLLTDLTQAVEARVKVAFDVSALSRETTPKEPSGAASLVYRSRVRTEPTNVTAAQWTNALWARLEVLVEDMASCCIKVYALEKVLKLKKDPATQISFLDEVMQTLESKPSSTFWTSLAVALEKYSKDAANSSSFLQQTLSNSYPRLLRLFHDFFAKITVHTDTVYNESQQSPETVLTLRAISRFENMYLTRSTSRLNETVANVLAGGVRSPPSMTEGLGIARVVANELDSARFDPLLVRSVAKNVVASLENFLGRINTLASRDRMATLLTGPNATPQQLLNAQLASALYACWNRLKSLESEHYPSVVNIISPIIKNVRTAFDRLVDPLISAIRRELTSIVARLHRVDFSDKAPSAMESMGGGTSAYMKDLLDKLESVRTGVLARFNVGELAGEWSISIVKHVVRTFVLHASLARPLGESGKLQLTSDMTELEFALSAFMVTDYANSSPSKTNNRHSRRIVTKLDTIGDDYKALRGMRPLLFLETPLLASPASTVGLPTLIVIHHIIVRSTSPALALPHTIHEWSEAEYVKWVEEHDENDALKLVHACLPKWDEAVSKARDKGDQDASDVEGDNIDYSLLVRTVLANVGFSQ